MKAFPNNIPCSAAVHRLQCAVHGQLNYPHWPRCQDPMGSFSVNPATEGCLQYPSTTIPKAEVYRYILLNLKNLLKPVKPPM